MEHSSPRETLAAMEEGYARFWKELPLRRGTALGEVMSNLLRPDGNPKVNELVSSFAQALEGWVGELAGQLAALPPEEADEWAGRALEQMLFLPPPEERGAELYLAAFEGFALPLVPFLSPEQRAVAAKRYGKRNPPRRMLPNQKKLLGALSGR